MWSDGLPSSVSDLFVGDVFSVRDAEEFSEASHLHGLFISMVKYNHAGYSLIFVW